MRADLGDNARMELLRATRMITRLVLVWFALALGAAIASPLVKPQAMQLVCASGGALKLLVTGDDGGEAASSHTLDCPLCATPAAPPPTLARQVPPPHPLAHVLRAIPAARMAALTRSPLPARGPPASV